MAEDDTNINNDATPETPDDASEQPKPAEPESTEDPAQPEAAADADEAQRLAEEAVAGDNAQEPEPTPEELAMLAMVQEAVDGAQNDVNDVVGAENHPSSTAATPESGAVVFETPSFAEAATSGPKSGIDLLGDVNLDVKIELGRTRMFIEDVLKLGDGAVVELDKLAGDPVDVYVNDRHIARGEVLVLNDNFCVRINEIIKPADDETSAA